MAHSGSAGRTRRSVAALVSLLLGGTALDAAQALDPVPTLTIFTPVALDADPGDGSVWIADQYACRIIHAGTDGSPLSVIPCAVFGGGKPAGLAMENSPSGGLYLSDPQGQRVIRIDRQGLPTGSFPVGALGVLSAADLALDPADGTLYLADPPNRRILHLLPRDLDADGQIDGADLLGAVDTAPFGSDNPTGVELDPTSGHLQFSDPGLDRVFEITPAGSLVNSFDTSGLGGYSVTGIARNPGAGGFRLADAGRKILSVSPVGQLTGRQDTAPFGSLSPQGLLWEEGTATLTMVTGERKMIRFQPEPAGPIGSIPGIVVWRQEWTTPFGSTAPSGIAREAVSGDRFVTDRLQARVFRVGPMGSALASFDTAGLGSPSPSGLALGPGGTSLFLSDNVARRIVQVSLAGAAITDFSTSPFRHAPRTEPDCNDPQGIAYDAVRDHLFVVDGQAARVYEVTPAGNFVAAFGTAPAAPYPTDIAVDPAGDRLLISNSSGAIAEFSRDGLPLASYLSVPTWVRIPGPAGVSVDRASLRRVVTDGANFAVLFLSPSGAALAQISLFPYGIQSPGTAAWSAGEARLYVSGRTPPRLYALAAGPDGAFGNADDIVAWTPLDAYGTTPEQAVLDTAGGRIGWVDALTRRLHWMTPQFSHLGSVDLSGCGVSGPRGADQDPTSGFLFLTDPAMGMVVTDAAGNPVPGGPNPSVGDPGGTGLSPEEGVQLVVDRSNRTLVSLDRHAMLLPETTGLGFADPGLLSWSPSPVFGGYDLLRGSLGELSLGTYGGCQWSGPLPPAPDSQSPPEGEGWFYLVYGRNPTGRGSLGLRSDGAPRPFSAVSPLCP